MTDVFGDPGIFPRGFVDPIENPDLPWITSYDVDQPDPVPAHRLDDEPATVKVKVSTRLLFGLPLPRTRVPSAVAGISLTDYSRGPDGKGWGSPCSGQRATVTVGAARVTVDVRITELVGLIMRNAESRGYTHRAADTGAYNCRKISGSTSWSNHAWALAIDINWQSNPYTSPLRTDIPVWYRDLWNRYGFAWGGDYSGKRDAMHFEFMGTPAQAQAALELARRELGGAPAPAPASTPTSGPVVDEQLRRDQANLNDTGFPCGLPDGINGPATIAATRAFQRAAGLAVDGEIGPATRAALAKVPSWRGPFVGTGGYSDLLWQQKLKQHGWRIATDNAWGNHSGSILGQYQREKRLERTDGWRCAESWTSLYCTVN